MFAKDSFKDKVVVITGGATGIGKELALEFAGLGANLVLASRNLENLEALKAEIGDRAKVQVVQTNVKESDQVKNLMETAVKEFGTIDILVNNAGANFLCPADKISDNGWHAVIEVVLTGSFYCMREAFPYMKAKKYGRIINMSSTTAWTGSPFMSHSGAAKAGLSNLTKTTAVEWARYGITVNEVCPGPVFTEGSKERLWQNEKIVEEIRKSFPSGHFPVAKDIIGPVLFLASDYAASVTGASLAVDGGESLRYNPNLMSALLQNG
jgi:NAD(P)-dependent dehydrogenase (short-subunit alcohol dehydrogenase family)